MSHLTLASILTWLVGGGTAALFALFAIGSWLGARRHRKQLLSHTAPNAPTLDAVERKLDAIEERFAERAREATGLPPADKPPDDQR